MLVGMEWTDLSKDRERWWAVVNKVTHLRVPRNAGKFFLPGNLLRKYQLFREDCFSWI
jgi:hypothetical protein